MVRLCSTELVSWIGSQTFGVQEGRCTGANWIKMAKVVLFSKILPSIQFALREGSIGYRRWTGAFHRCLSSRLWAGSPLSMGPARARPHGCSVGWPRTPSCTTHVLHYLPRLRKVHLPNHSHSPRSYWLPYF